MALRTLPRGQNDISTLTVLDADSIQLLEGSQTVNAGLTAHTGLATGLTNFLGGEKFLGNLGDGNPYEVDIDAGDATGIWRSPGRCYIKAGGLSGVISTWEQSNGTCYFSGGTFTTTRVSRGTLHVTDATVMTTLYMTGGVAGSLGTPIGYNATALTTLLVDRASIWSERGVSGTARILNGATAVIGRQDSTQTAPTIGTLELHGGSRLVYSGGNITTAWVTDSIIDLSQVVAPITIGTLNIDRASYNRSAVAGALSLVTITTTNFIDGDPTQFAAFGPPSGV